MLAYVMCRFFFIDTDPDYWWHLRTGGYIYRTGTVPQADLYSYTANGQPWVAHEWLTELLFYLGQQAWGYVGNVALFGAVHVGMMLAIYAACRLRGVSELGSTGLTLWAFAMGTSSVNVRPQAITGLFFAVFVLVLTRYREGSTRWLWLMPPLMCLWVNLHGGYAIGLGLICVTLIGEMVGRLLGQKPVSMRPLLLVGVGCAATSLLNPRGIGGLLYPLSYLGSDNFAMRRMLEWQSPNFHDPQWLTFAASLVLALVLGVARRPLGPTEALWAVVFAVMGLQSVRHVLLFGIVIMPLLGARLRTEIPALGRTIAEWRHPGRVALLWASAVAVCSVLLVVRGIQAGSGPQIHREPRTATYPVGGVDYILRNNPPGRILNELVWGGYLIYRLYPERQVFIDGRADLYGNQLLDRYGDIVDLNPRWREVLDEYDVRLALLRKGSPLAVTLASQKDWELLYTGDVEQLFAKQSGSPSAQPIVTLSATRLSEY